MHYTEEDLSVQSRITTPRQESVSTKFVFTSLEQFGNEIYHQVQKTFENQISIHCNDLKRLKKKTSYQVWYLMTSRKL